MKKRNKVLLTIICTIIIISIIVVSINWDNITLPKYDYTSDGYTYGGIININGVIYEGINKEIFEEILHEMKINDIESYSHTPLGIIEYTNANHVWKYKIYGNKNTENRILLTGEEAYIFNDANYPEVYFCRQDILQSLGDSETE